VFIIFFILTSAYSKDLSQDSKIILDNADIMRSVGDVRNLIGNVRIRHRDKVITADRARYNSKSGIIEMNRNVELYEPEQMMTANKVTYYEKTGNYEAIGNTDFTRLDSIRIRCNVAKFHDDEDMLDLVTNVIINNLSDGATITGNRGEWFNLNNSAVITGNPVYMLPYSNNDDEDTLIINSNQITFYQSSNLALFTGEVTLQLGELLAESDSLMHMPDSSITILSGSPIIWRDTDKLSGGKILLYFVEKELNRIEVIGDGSILSEAHPEKGIFNILTGETLNISIINDSTRFVQAAGDAVGDYHIWDENDVYQGENVSTANSIDILMEGNKASSISLLGHTSGTFYPPKFVPEADHSISSDKGSLK